MGDTVGEVQCDFLPALDQVRSNHIRLDQIRLDQVRLDPHFN